VQTVVVVGVGALGSHVVQFLRAAGVKLKAIDFDRVESKNVLSQFHAKNSVGQNKTVAIQKAMQFLWGFKVEGVPHKLTADNATELLRGADLVLDCLDNGEARRQVQHVVRKLDLQCLHGALAADGLLGRVIWDDRFRIDDEEPGQAATCEDGAHLPFIGMVSAYLARSAQAYLDSGRRLSFQVYPSGAATLL